jgi:hypothetical protein
MRQSKDKETGIEKIPLDDHLRGGNSSIRAE